MSILPVPTLWPWLICAALRVRRPVIVPVVWAQRPLAAFGLRTLSKGTHARLPRVDVSLFDGCEGDGSLVDCPHLDRLSPPVDDYRLCVPVSDQVDDNVVRSTGNFARPATVCPGVAGAAVIVFPEKAVYPF